MNEMQRILKQISSKPLTAPIIIGASSNKPTKKNPSKNPTNVGPTTMKGTNPGVNKEGGDGTSKDAQQRRRRRQMREGKYNN